MPQNLETNSIISFIVKDTGAGLISEGRRAPINSLPVEVDEMDVFTMKFFVLKT